MIKEKLGAVFYFFLFFFYTFNQNYLILVRVFWVEINVGVAKALIDLFCWSSGLATSSGSTGDILKMSKTIWIYGSPYSIGVFFNKVIIDENLTKAWHSSQIIYSTKLKFGHVA